MKLRKIVKKFYIERFVIYAFLLIVLCFVITKSKDFVIGFISIIAFTYTLLYSLIDRKKIFNLLKKNKEIYDEEFKNICLKTKEYSCFTENYAFLFGRRIEFCKYDEILLIYKNTEIHRMIGFVSYFNIVTKLCTYHIVLHHLHSNVSNEEIENDLEKLLLKKNPNILIGKTKENKKILKEKYNKRIF